MFLNTQKNEIFEYHGKRYLIYPLDNTVLRELDPVHAKRWIKTGWDIEKTTLLEIRHPTIPHGHPLNIGYASDLFNGLIIAWSRNVYFRVVVFTPNFFQHKTDLLLKIKVWHEK